MNKTFFTIATITIGIFCATLLHKNIASNAYVAKNFNFSQLPFLSEKQKNEHYLLYKGYVAKLNEIRQQLKSIKPSANTTYSEYRSLKVAETFALNGVILHELYFENIIEGAGTKMGALTKKLITESFESEKAYLDDLKMCSLSSRGWVITGYSITDKKIHNFLLDAHNQTVPVLVIPLLVIDIYEHAYMIDFGIQRAEYLNVLFPFFNWNVVEARARHLELFV